LCIDADEVVEDFTEIKKFIKRMPKGVYSVKMRHLIGDLGHEDATVETHYVLNRLFKIEAAGEYPEVEHPVLQAAEGMQIAATNCTTIWHLAYIPNMWDIKRRYDNHVKKSNIHTPEYLRQWYYAHLFGKYPVREFNPAELPREILSKFDINKDELYFAGRNLEVKHFIDAMHWRDYFKIGSFIEFGAGLGPRTFAMRAVGLLGQGYELSQWAVDHAMTPLIQNDLTKGIAIPNPGELVVAYDVLEHIDPEKLDFAIKCLITASDKYVLISVPVIGDPNLENDPTHKTKETAEWWIEQFVNKQCKHIKTPEHFLFKDQVFIFEVPSGNTKK
jgi:hypothetical protein